MGVIMSIFLTINSDILKDIYRKIIYFHLLSQKNKMIFCAKYLQTKYNEFKYIKYKMTFNDALILVYSFKYKNNNIERFNLILNNFIDKYNQFHYPILYKIFPFLYKKNQLHVYPKMILNKKQKIFDEIYNDFYTINYSENEQHIINFIKFNHNNDNVTINSSLLKEITFYKDKNNEQLRQYAKKFKFK